MTNRADSIVDTTFNIWEHLFTKGEYPAREKLLSGLTIEQINKIPDGMSHSIYEELWHLVEWQDVSCSNDKEKELKWENGPRFPEHKLTDLKQWDELVKKFNDQVHKIIEYAADPENLKKEETPDFSIADGLSCLAVHNAVHFGKILAIRQAIGAWPPTEKQV